MKVIYSYSLLKVLLSLRNHSPQIPKYLANHANIPQGTLYNLLRMLVERKVAKRHVDDENIVVYSLTDEGKKLADTFKAELSRLINQ